MKRSAMARGVFSVGSCLLFCGALAAQQAPGFKFYNSYEEYCRATPKAPTCVDGKPASLNDAGRNAQKILHLQSDEAKAIGSIHQSPARPRVETIAPPPKAERMLSLQPGWAFAHPNAELLMGVNVASLRQSPLVRSVLKRLAVELKLPPESVDKVLTRADGVEQVWISGRAGDTLCLLQGTQIPSPAQMKNGMVVRRISPTAVLVGRPAAVAGAVQRLKNPPVASATVRRIRELAGENDLWGTGTAALLKQANASPAMSSPGAQGLSGFSIAASLRDGLNLRMELHYRTEQEAHRLLPMMQARSDGGHPPVPVSTEVEGSTVRVSVKASKAEVEQGMDRALAGKLGRLLAGIAGGMQQRGAQGSAGSGPAISVLGGEPASAQGSQGVVSTPAPASTPSNGGITIIGAQSGSGARP